MKLKVGIISASWGTFAHLPAWRAIPGIEVVAVCTSRRETAEAAASRHGIARPFWDAQLMAADPDIDIVDCGTRPNLREPMVLACLSQGKHVYNAIPFAASFAGARALHQAWLDCGTVGVVDAFSQWIPAHRLAREMIESGYLGQPFGGTCVFNISLFDTLNPGFAYNWFAQAGQGVSAMRNLGSQALHMMIFLFGEITEVVAHDGQLLDTWRAPDGTAIRAETNDFASMLLRFASGLVMQCQVSWSATIGAGWILEAFGAEGRILMQSPTFPTSRDTALYAGRRGSTELAKIEIPERLRHAASLGIDAECQIQPAFPMALSMQTMVQAIEGVSEPRPDFAQAWMVERIQEAVRVSSAERRWVRVDEIV